MHQSLKLHLKAPPGASLYGTRAAPGERASALLRSAARGAAAIVAATGRSPLGRRALAGAALVGALVAFGAHVREEVRSSPAHRVAKASLAATAPPRGLKAEAIEDLGRLPFPERTFSVYDDLAARRIAGTYARLPWVREVRGVEIVFPAGVRFDLEVRRPLATLEHRGRAYLLDEEGLLLPRRCYEDPAEAPGLDGRPRAVLVKAPLGARRLLEGSRLDDACIRHGLEVAKILREVGPELRSCLSPVVRIDVENVGGAMDPRRAEIVLVTARDTVIEWGRSPLTDNLDIDVAEKLAKLRKLADRDPTLASFALVRLQFDDLDWRERARPSEQAAAPGAGAVSRSP